MKISACGLICDDCQFFQKECTGCFMMNGKPFWTAQATVRGICPLYDCSINQKGYRNCGECNELPCKMFTDLKDPNISDTEHQDSIQSRIKNLRRL